MGLLNELVAAGLFYLIFRIIFSVVRISKIRRTILLLFLIFWVVINYFNYQYASSFNTLLPISWFFELKNISGVGDYDNFIYQNLEFDIIYLVLIPLVVSIYFIYYFYHYWGTH